MSTFPIWMLLTARVPPLAIAIAAVLAGASLSRADDASQARIVEVRRIWDAAPHNAFTDLVWRDGHWFCVFREGAKHVSPDGALRVLSSTDGATWSSSALIRSTDSDLRDAKISIAPGNRLMLCGAGALHEPVNGMRHQSYVWYSEDGRDWGEPIPIGDPGFWLWRIVWHDDIAYAVGYSTALDRSTRTTRLYRSTDGRTFEVIVPELNGAGRSPGESSLLFDSDGSSLCIVRHDDPKEPAALLGSSRSPYREWTWKSLQTRLGGPQVIRLPDGRLVVGGRDSIGPPECNLWWLDPETAKLTTLATLPSGGDTSYPGLVFRDGLLWVSYYSSHEEKTSIYLAKVKLPDASDATR
ncbi:hypothetical protein Pan44_05190 [Caulifigura coniformis]|uniref:Exo-alpha-sialidase n=1 Tax=Caulifigura coniformis TaxID=2527983 RepID=A0A517S8Q1_9PLAN|nr:sialidase family protein [Caulifigura coniformis]QDT52507.1 hypothetical protein Pan44_05190 [Caulifigura coniformis]